MESQSGALTRLGLDKSELKSIKVAIMRRNVSEPSTSGPLLRSVEDPADLKIHYRPDEGSRPIFDRDDVIVNVEREERTVLASTHSRNDRTATSRSSSQSSRTSSERDLPTQKNKRSSPEPRVSRDHSTDNYRRKDYFSKRNRRSSSNSRKAIYRSGYPCRRSKSPERGKKRERSPPPSYNKPRSEGSPRRYAGPSSDRRTSRSPVSEIAREKYRRLSERKRTRSPPSRSSRARSRSYSPHRRRSRYSKSPHRHDDRRYERSKRSRSPRSRSPRRRYSPERRSRRSSHEEALYEPPGMPPYFEGAEFWVPNPMLQPRFMPRQMFAPGVFPYPFRPGMPAIIPPRVPFRPRIIYNNRQVRQKTPQTASSSTVVASSSRTATNAATSMPDDNEKTAHESECATENKQHSSTKSE